MRTDADRRTAELLVEPTDEGAAWSSCFLGNDDWIVYHSSEAGNFELYVTHVTTDPTVPAHLDVARSFPSWDPGERGGLFSEIGSDILYSLSVDFPGRGRRPDLRYAVPALPAPARELDNAVDVYGDEVVLGTGPAQRPGLDPDARDRLAAPARRLEGGGRCSRPAPFTSLHFH